MRQKRSDVDVPIGPSFSRGLCIVDDGDKPVPILSDVKDHVVIHMIGVLKYPANFRKIVPSDRSDDAQPRFDLVRRIWVAFYRLPQVFTRNDMH
jgi:hypothetical protein